MTRLNKVASFTGALFLLLLTSCVQHVVKKPPVVKEMEVVTQPEVSPETPTKTEITSSSHQKWESKTPKLESKTRVKIGLRIEVEQVGISCDGPMMVIVSDSNEKIRWRAGKHMVSVQNNHLVADGKSYSGGLRIIPVDSGHYLENADKKFRGDFLVHRSGSRVTLINQIGIDDYLRGVLPREVVVSWPLESLKVQAVASRTYLVSHLGRHSAQGFDLCSDVHCQVYGGMGKEHPMCDRAVEETRGQVLTYNGKPIDAYFHSNCGGETEEVEYVWGLTHQPYLPRVKCPYGTGDPRYNWSFDYSSSVMLSLLKSKTKVKGSTLESFKVLKKSPSGRAERVSVKTNEGTFEMSGNEFRVTLDPEKIRSTLWTSVERSGKGYEFRGRGWGHGIGMCQWGAKGQAEHGRTYDEILRFYYPHTTLTQWSRP